MNVKRLLPVAVLMGLSALVVGVYALTAGVAPNPGHTLDSVAPPASCLAGQIIKWNGVDWTCVAESGLPTGVLGQTLRHNGASWIANSVLFNNGVNIGIGTNAPKNKLDVEGSAVVGSTYSGTNTAPAEGLLVQGNVGIGTATPQSRLQVNGGVQFGADAAACNAAKAGTIRYNAGKVEYCNGIQWKDLATPTTTFAVCADADSSTWCTAGSINQCSCGTGTLISKVQSDCTVTSDTGSCTAHSSICWPTGPDYGTCCVCRP